MTSAWIEMLPALLFVVGFLGALGVIAGQLSRIAAALEYANQLTVDAWRDVYRQGQIDKPQPLRRAK